MEKSEKSKLAAQVKKIKRKPRVQIAPWSKEETVQLIEAIKNHPILWDTSLKEYSQTQKKENVLSQIADDINRERLDVKTKWQNLKCQFNGELRKMKDRRRNSGDNGVYVSKWHFMDLMQFLPKGSEINSSVNSFDDESNVSFESAVETPCSSARLASRRGQPTNVQNEAIMNIALQMMKRPQDSCQVFGDFVAQQLRTLTPRTCKKLELQIQRSILAARQEDEDADKDVAMPLVSIKEEHPERNIGNFEERSGVRYPNETNYGFYGEK